MKKVMIIAALALALAFGVFAGTSGQNVAYDDEKVITTAYDPGHGGGG